MPEQKLPLGVYDPDASNDVAHYYVDEHGLGVTYTSNKGLGDSIGRALTWYWITDDPQLIEGIVNCWQKSPEHNNKIVGIRHPDYVEKENKKWYQLGARMSRDHYINTLIALKIWEQRNGKKHPKFKEIVKATPFGIRKMARWTLGLILWSKALNDSKVALWFYLIIDIILSNILYIPLRKIADKLCGWETEMEQDEWEKLEHNTADTNLQYHPKWKQRIDKMVLPSYAIWFSCRQLYVTPDTFPKLKKCAQKSLLKMVGNTNYAQQMVLGKKGIPRDKVEAFKHMRGGRWGGYLNNRNDRNMQVMKEGRFPVNQQDVMLIRYLYNETQID
jgi:hypothetical protein